MFRGWFCLRILWEQSHPLDLQGVDLFGTIAMCWPQYSENLGHGWVCCRCRCWFLWFGDPFFFVQPIHRKQIITNWPKGYATWNCDIVLKNVPSLWSFGLHFVFRSTAILRRLWTSWHYENQTPYGKSNPEFFTQVVTNYHVINELQTQGSLIQVLEAEFEYRPSCHKTFYDCCSEALCDIPSERQIRWDFLLLGEHESHGGIGTVGHCDRQQAPELFGSGGGRLPRENQKQRTARCCKFDVSSELMSVFNRIYPGVVDIAVVMLYEYAALNCVAAKGMIPRAM